MFSFTHRFHSTDDEGTKTTGCSCTTGEDNFAHTKVPYAAA